MLAKKFALGFGIAIIFPMLVHYGVATFSPAVAEKYAQIELNHEKYKNAPLKEREKLEKKISVLYDELFQEKRNFQKKLFFVTLPVGIAAIVIGGFISVQAVATGLMFGGIFTLLDGYALYWGELPDWLRFLSLLAALAALIFMGYRKMPAKD